MIALPTIAVGLGKLVGLGVGKFFDLRPYWKHLVYALVILVIFTGGYRLSSRLHMASDLRAQVSTLQKKVKDTKELLETSNQLLADGERQKAEFREKLNVYIAQLAKRAPADRCRFSRIERQWLRALAQDASR